MLGSALLLKHSEQDREPRQAHARLRFCPTCPPQAQTASPWQCGCWQEEGAHHGPRREGVWKKWEPKLPKPGFAAGNVSEGKTEQHHGHNMRAGAGGQSSTVRGVLASGKAWRGKGGTSRNPKVQLCDESGWGEKSLRQKGKRCVYKRSCLDLHARCKFIEAWGAFLAEDIMSAPLSSSPNSVSLAGFGWLF